MSPVCPGCKQCFERTEGARIYCTPACKLADWKRRQRISPSPLKASRFVGGLPIRHIPSVHVGKDSRAAIDRAVASLAAERGLAPTEDPGALFHLLASLAADIELRMPDAVAAARGAGYSYEEIRALSGTSRERAQRLESLAATGKGHPVAGPRKKEEGPMLSET